MLSLYQYSSLSCKLAYSPDTSLSKIPEMVEKKRTAMVEILLLLSTGEEREGMVEFRVRMYGMIERKLGNLEI